MFKYAITLKPLLAVGAIESLDPARRKIFDGLVYATAKMFEATNEVTEVKVTEQFNIIVTSEQDIFDFLKQKLNSDNVICTRL